MLTAQLVRTSNMLTRRFTTLSKRPQIVLRQAKSVVPQRSMAVVHDLSNGQGVAWLFGLCGSVLLVGGYNFYKMMERLDFYENNVDCLVNFSNEEVLEIKEKIAELRRAREEEEEEDDEEETGVKAETEEIEQEIVIVAEEPTAAPVNEEVLKDTIIFVEPEKE